MGGIEYGSRSFVWNSSFESRSRLVQSLKPCLRTRQGRFAALFLFLGIIAVALSSTGVAQNRITILNDAFGKPSALEQDWGYSALIEFEGKRILFDTGDNLGIFERNVERMHVDLSR